METPADFDGFLHGLLKAKRQSHLSADDQAFIERILESITDGSQGVFIALHPNDRMQYMLLGVNRSGAMALLARVMSRIAEQQDVR